MRVRGRVQDTFGHERDEDAGHFGHEFGDDGFEFLEGAGVEVEGWRGVEGFELVGDRAGVHHVGTVGELNGGT